VAAKVFFLRLLSPIRSVQHFLAPQPVPPPKEEAFSTYFFPFVCVMTSARIDQTRKSLEFLLPLLVHPRPLSFPPGFFSCHITAFKALEFDAMSAWKSPPPFSLFVPDGFRDRSDFPPLLFWGSPSHYVGRVRPVVPLYHRPFTVRLMVGHFYKHQFSRETRLSS